MSRLLDQQVDVLAFLPSLPRPSSAGCRPEGPGRDCGRRDGRSRRTNTADHRAELDFKTTLGLPLFRYFRRRCTFAADLLNRSTKEGHFRKGAKKSIKNRLFIHLIPQVLQSATSSSVGTRAFRLHESVCSGQGSDVARRLLGGPWPGGVGKVNVV